MSGSNYIVEFIPQGRYVKVTAVDPLTGIEAVIVGDARQPRHLMETIVIQKLELIIAKS